jgi:hypothetical protein
MIMQGKSVSTKDFFRKRAQYIGGSRAKSSI